MKPMITIKMSPDQLYEMISILDDYAKMTSYDPANELVPYFRDQLADAFGLKGGEYNVEE